MEIPNGHARKKHRLNFSFTAAFFKERIYIGNICGRKKTRQFEAKDAIQKKFLQQNMRHKKKKTKRE